MTDQTALVDAPAVFSPDRVYRYVLRREWMVGEGTVLFIGLNPSSADENHNDPTIRRVVDFAKRWGFARLLMGNLFAFRATYPVELRHCPDPVGPQNNDWLLRMAKESQEIICAWGLDGSFQGRSEQVKTLLRRWGYPLKCLGLTDGAEPRHPLYLPKTARRLEIE